MQHVLCHFADSPEFLRHLEAGSCRGSRRALRVDLDFPLPEDETVRITLVIADSSECHDLHFQVAHRCPSIDPESGSLQWTHLAEPLSEDRPWLAMLVSKFQTAQRIQAT